MNGNHAILDRPRPVEVGAETPHSAAPVARRGPWLQLGPIDRYEWNRYELPLAALPPALEGLRILHLSDVHLKGAWHPALDDLHERVQRDVPDLIFITGDFVEDKFDGRPALRLVERFVTGLRSRFGMFAIIGNHDSDLLAPRVARWGVNMLPIGSHTISVRGAQVELIALAGFDRNDLTTQHVLDVRPRDAHTSPRVPRLVLSHYPDALPRLQAFDVAPDIHFAGHTHGGQVCLPGRVPIIKHDTLPRRCCTGVHRVDDTWLVVSRGMGYSSYPIRVFCPAEVVEVGLVSKNEG